MQVVPSRTIPFQDRKDLYQFLCDCQQKSSEKKHPQIASISLEIDPVDPLAVLQELAQPNQLHFYLEKGFAGEAIAAIDAVQSLKVDENGGERFAKTQAFIQSCLEHIVFTDGPDFPLARPRFFCSFTFFDQVSERHNFFPPATIFLPRWQVIRCQNSCVVTANTWVDPHSNLDRLTETIWEQLKKIRRIRYGLFNFTDEIRHSLNRWAIEDVNNFQTVVLSALNSIREQRLTKLVLAHAVDVTSRFAFHWIESLHNLRQQHRDCYVFSTGNGQGKSFIGASPERLISIHNQRLITDALAGSAPRGKTVRDDATLAQQLLKSGKERREHQLVVDFIIHSLAQFGLSPQLTATPKLLRLSNIQHLHTPIRANISPHIHPLEVLAALHPTPAVAGMPRDIACEQIRHYETFERSLYAAPLGWVDHRGNAEFIVGIRSALIEGNRTRLYAGAGIVAGSDPERELAEIKLKLQALLQALV